jgi:hypothetical protein
MTLKLLNKYHKTILKIIITLVIKRNVKKLKILKLKSHRANFTLLLKVFSSKIF